MIVDWTDEFDRWLTHAEKLGARRHELWRVAHPFDPAVAVRLICWFPSTEEVVIALLGFDKKAIGDVFYASAVARGEALVDAWLRQKGITDD